MWAGIGQEPCLAVGVAVFDQVIVDHGVTAPARRGSAQMLAACAVEVSVSKAATAASLRLGRSFVWLFSQD